jgi:hypothetical protein
MKNDPIGASDLEGLTVSSNARLVYVCILMHPLGRGLFKVSIDDISELSGLSVRAVAYELQQLHASGTLAHYDDHVFFIKRKCIGWVNTVVAQVPDKAQRAHFTEALADIFANID